MANKLGEMYRGALVTGVTSGLGKAFAEMLKAEGVEVWGTSRKAENIPVGEGIYPLALDLADGASVGQFLQAMEPVWPRLDLVVNNAGNGIFNRFEQFEPDQIGEQLRVLLHGPMALCHAALPGFLAQGRGTLVNVASLAREFPLPYFSLYNAAKAGLSNFTRSLQTELVGTGVTTIDFQPGDYRTRFNDSAARPEELELHPRLEQAWNSLEKHLSEAPLPEKAARDLRRALMRGKSGVVYSGDCFQTKLAPFLARFGTWNLVECAMRAYYKL